MRLGWWRMGHICISRNSPKMLVGARPRATWIRTEGGRSRGSE